MTDNRDHVQRVIGDRYRLERIAGHGGMSTVWLAHDCVEDRPVAIKVLGQEFTDSGEFLSRFRNEAQAVSHIVNEHVVRTFDYEEVVTPDGHTLCFIVMEFVFGKSLADILEAHGALDEPWALDILEQAAEGLTAIHEQGLVHRDVKPGNILITEDGMVKLTDFGIAKAAAQAPLTKTGMVVGTAQYVSPEQAQGLDVTPSTDVYSLAVVGYEMLAGVRPFTGDSSVSVAIAHINTPPPQITTDVSDNARELIGIGLRKDPARRYATGEEFVAAVRAVQMGLRPPQPQSLPARSSRPQGVTKAAARTPVAAAGASQSAPAAAVGGPEAAVAVADDGVSVKQTAAWVAAGLLVLAGVAGAIYMVVGKNHDEPPAPSQEPVTVVTATETVSVPAEEEPSSTATSSSSSAAPSSSSETTSADTVTREPETVTVTETLEPQPEPEPVQSEPVPEETSDPEPEQEAPASPSATEDTPSDNGGAEEGEQQ
ncbi:serine/threonine-protein kinase [Corynebacterium aquilae]|uniref:serine/threonine-protein kinase n=1 Tax=Corynebacterium aquilae TaxID=203263 RepID=UPI0009512EE7|nr:serine/threonine-protein kinase [Corynebacterium aquilae]